MKDIVHLQLNICAGSSFDEAVDVAWSWHDKVEIVTFDFNGIKFAITANDTKKDIVKYRAMAMLADKWCQRF